jgi:hypothetical protein
MPPFHEFAPTNSDGLLLAVAWWQHAAVEEGMQRSDFYHYLKNFHRMKDWLTAKSRVLDKRHIAQLLFAGSFVVWFLSVAATNTSLCV